MKHSARQEFHDILYCLIGTLIYDIGMNIFLQPENLYASGFMGISQLIAYAVGALGISSANVQPFAFFMINVPLFIAGFFLISKRFIARSFFLVMIESIFLSMIPIPDIPILKESIASCIIGGTFQGIGVGITLIGFGCGGGTDLLGIIVSKKKNGFSVGKVNLLINTCIYLFCAYLFSLETAIYSFVASLFCSYFTDLMHKQNNNVSVNILSKKDREIRHYILHDLQRAATLVDATGAYAQEKMTMIIVIMSEYDLRYFQEKLLEIDPDAFVFVQPNITVSGHYDRRLSSSHEED